MMIAINQRNGLIATQTPRSERSTIIKLACLSLVLLLFLGCNENEPEEIVVQPPLVLGYISGPPTSSEHDTVNINVQAEINAVAMAISDINNAGGVSGEPVNLIRENGQHDSVISTDAARKLVEEHNAVAIIGPGWSSTTIAAFSGVSEPNGILHITHSATSTDLSNSDETNLTVDFSDAKDLLFRTIVSDEYVGASLAALLEELGYKQPAILHVDNPYGNALMETVVAALPEGKASAIIPHTSGEEDNSLEYWSKQLEPLSGTDTDVLVAIGYEREIVAAVDTAMTKGLVNNFLFADYDLVSPIIWLDQPGGKKRKWADAMQGMFGVSAAAEDSAAKSQFENNYMEMYPGSEGNEGAYMGHIYDATILLSLASAYSGSTTSSTGIRDALRIVAGPPGEPVGLAGDGGIERALELARKGIDIDYEGVAGPQNFNENGDVIANVLVWKIVDGHFLPERFVAP